MNRLLPLLAALAAAAWPALALAGGHHSHQPDVSPPPPLALVLPFVLLLAAIAVAPLTHARLWASHRNKALLTALLSAPIVAWYLYVQPAELTFHLGEYGAFILLIGALYTLSGGILLRGNRSATPWVNTAFLATGAVLANLLGTTGASVVLIRPLLRTNQQRRNKVHTVVFFIFLVSNIGGALTPLGDPPLYMGFLRGVPFLWTLRLWPQWLTACGALLVIHHLLDRRAFRRERPEDVAADARDNVPLGLDGWVNVALLMGLLVTNFFIHQPWLCAAVTVGLTALSLEATPKAVRETNGFRWGPLTEVAVLFAGLFVTMIPALVLLEQAGARLAISRPWQFFWAAGTLSSVLDNTPTYIAFLSLAQGVRNATDVSTLISSAGGERILAALALGAVFMGANTYIGNGPNFLVKSIAEEAGPTHVDMPSFGRYILWALAILVPLFVVLTLLFFRNLPETT